MRQHRPVTVAAGVTARWPPLDYGLAGRTTNAARTTSQLGLIVVLTIAGVLETWTVTISGYANGYYAEAAQAASTSWTALLTNAADPSHLVSLDKGPLADWAMGLSGRALGFGPLSVLLPSVLYALASVAILHDVVRRVFGRQAALLAALMLALSPVSVLIGRYDNPDGLLALLLAAASWALVRALESRQLRHLLLCGALVGLGFNTKMLEALLIVPGLAGAYLLAARRPMRRRVGELVAAGAVMVAVSMAWYGTMMLLPASDRPYVAETSGNSWFQLIFEGNGLNRITGLAGARQSASGPLRLFSSEIAGQAGWLMPLALLGFIAGAWLTRRSRRTDRGRAALVLFALWMLAGYGLFSFSRGTFHSYYTSSIAPPIAALAAAAVVRLGEHATRSRLARFTLAVGLLGTAVLSWVILADTPRFLPWLRWVVLVGGAIAALAVSLLDLDDRAKRRSARAILAAAALLAVLGGPTAYSIATLGFGRTGANPTAGPRALTSPRGGVGNPLPLNLPNYLQTHRDGARFLVAATGSDFAAPIGLETRAPVVTLGGFAGDDLVPTVPRLASLVRSGELHSVLLELPARSSAARRRARWVTSHCDRVKGPPGARTFVGENGARGSSGSGLYHC